MKKKILSLFLLVGMLVSIFGTGVCVLAYDVQGSATLTRGGSRQFVGSDYKGISGGWEAKLSSISVVGLPSGIFGNNYVAGRMRTEDGSYPASDTITYSSANYQTNTSQSYDTDNGYGGVGITYSFYSSMSSSSANTGCTVTFLFFA